MSSSRMLGYCEKSDESNGVRTPGPPCKKLGGGIEWEDSLFQLH